MAWASTLTASASWAATGGGGIAPITWTPSALPAIPTGANGMVSVLTTSGQPPTGAVTAITTGGATVTGTVANSSGQIFAIVGHSIIA